MEDETENQNVASLIMLRNVATLWRTEQHRDPHHGVFSASGLEGARTQRIR